MKLWNTSIDEREVIYWRNNACVSFVSEIRLGFVPYWKWRKYVKTLEILYVNVCCQRDVEEHGILIHKYWHIRCIRYYVCSKIDGIRARIGWKVAYLAHSKCLVIEMWNLKWLKMPRGIVYPTTNGWMNSTGMGRRHRGMAYQTEALPPSATKPYQLVNK